MVRKPISGSESDRIRTPARVQRMSIELIYWESQCFGTPPTTLSICRPFPRSERDLTHPPSSLGDMQHA